MTHIHKWSGHRSRIVDDYERLGFTPREVNLIVLGRVAGGKNIPTPTCGWFRRLHLFNLKFYGETAMLKRENEQLRGQLARFSAGYASELSALASKDVAVRRELEKICFPFKTPHPKHQETHE